MLLAFLRPPGRLVQVRRCGGTAGHGRSGKMVSPRGPAYRFTIHKMSESTTLMISPVVNGK